MLRDIPKRGTIVVFDADKPRPRRFVVYGLKAGAGRSVIALTYSTDDGKESSFIARFHDGTYNRDAIVAGLDANFLGETIARDD